MNNTFGIKGVQEHCFFLKSIDDAHRLRVHVRWAGRVGGWLARPAVPLLAGRL